MFSRAPRAVEAAPQDDRQLAHPSCLSKLIHSLIACFHALSCCPPGKLPFEEAPQDDRQLADIHLALYNDVIVFDHATKLAYVISWVRTFDRAFDCCWVLLCVAPGSALEAALWLWHL